MATEAETPTISTTAPDTSGVAAAPASTSSAISAATPDIESDADADDDNREFLFDASAWDGKVDSLPEPYRPIGQRYEQKLAALESAARDRDEYRLLYEALTDGTEDPRIAKHTGELSERDAKLAKVQAEHDRVKAEYDTLMGEIEKAQEEQARDAWNAFKAANPVLARSEKGRATIASLLEEGFDFDQVAVVAELPRKDADALRALVKGGTPAAVAIELTQLRLGTKRKSEESSAAHLVSGSTTPATNVASMAEGRRGKRTYSEASEEAIANAFRQSRKG